jgi:hypothetical protein
MADPRGTIDGATSLGDGGGRRKLLPLLLGLLAALVALVVVIGLLSGDDSDGDDAASRAGAPAATAQQASPVGGASTAGGSLRAGDVDVLTDPDRLDDAIDQAATGTSLEVLEVVENRGFFVGTGNLAGATYVEFGDQVGTAEQERTRLPEVGDRVDFEGVVRPAPTDPTQGLELDEAAAARVAEQGAYVNATNVQPATP